MAMIQGGIIGLRIESGQRKGEPRGKRIYQSCTIDEIEDAWAKFFNH